MPWFGSGSPGRSSLQPATGGGGGGSTFDFYISPTGSDANPGTQVSPFALTALNTKSIIQGKRVGLLNGIYVITGVGTGNGGYILSVTQGGPSAVQPTFVGAVNARAAIITTNNAGSYPQATAAALGVLANNVTFDGITFQQFSFSAMQVSGSNVTIQNCNLADADLNRFPTYAASFPGDNIGLVLTANSGNNLVISNCNATHVRNGNQSHNAACLGPFFHYTNITIDSCTVADATTGIYFKDDVAGYTVKNCFVNGASGNMYEGIFGLMGYQSTHPGFPNSAGFNNIINNVNQPINTADGDRSCNTTFYNNTVIASAAPDPVLANYANQSVSTNNFYNNIWQLTSGSSFVYVFQVGSNGNAPSFFSVLDYNCYPQTNFSMLDHITSTTLTTLANWRTFIGKDAAAIQTNNPLFVNATPLVPADFKLQGGSPCAGTGKIGGIPGGAQTDIGAWGNGAQQIGCSFPAAVTTVTQGQSFTITGSGFGIKSGAGLVLDDHGQAGVGVIDPQWHSNHPASSFNPGLYAPFYMLNQATNFNPTGANVGAPNPYVSAIIAGAHCGDVTHDGPWGVNVIYQFATLPNPPFVIYARWYEREDPNWTFINAPGRNLKMVAYANGLSNAWYQGWVFDNPGPTNNTLDHEQIQYLDNSLGAGAGQPATLEEPDRNGHGHFWNAGLAPNCAQNGWILREWEYCVDQTTGPTGKGFNNYLQQSTSATFAYPTFATQYAGRTDNFGGGFTDGSIPRQLIFGNGFFDGDYGAIGSGAENNWSYLADFRIDVTGTNVFGNCARVIMGDQPTYAASKIRSYCNVSSWSNTQITATFWKDKFATSTTAYAHVITESGAVLNNVANYTVL